MDVRKTRWVALLAALALGIIFAGAALGAEKLLVCGPCSRSFLPVAEKAVADLGLSGKVQVAKTSCLGDCAGAPVLEFRGQVYSRMTEGKLKDLLRKAKL
ncbi:(2Fe-2S) ferredoxin domain-containing protein [Aminomonas paucivorans]|uniref:(2Fe-2S) ferredoxin domain-containing protein n=1 Tax=Aminomonas paucivorans TaxID=81412 RepID=UPI00331A9941